MSSLGRSAVVGDVRTALSAVADCFQMDRLLNDKSRASARSMILAKLPSKA